MSNDLPSGFELDSDLPAGFQLDDKVAPETKATEQVYGRLPFQLATGAIKGLAAVPGSTPTALSALGNFIDRKMGWPEEPPVPYALTPEGKLGSILPRPQSEPEALAQDVGGAVSGGALSKGHWAENLVGGVGAGLGAHYGPQIAPTFGMTPNEGAIAGAITGGVAGAHVTGNVANAITRSAMPNPDQIIADTSKGYDALRIANRQIGVSRDDMANIKNTALQWLRAYGPSEEEAKNVYSAINAIDETSPGNAGQLINIRQNLHDELHSIKPNANKPAAIMALGGIDKAIEMLAAPGTSAELRRLDANWGAARATQAVTGKIAGAEEAAGTVNSGLNSGNKILQSIRSYIKSRTDQYGKVHMDPNDLAALQKVYPGIGENLMRFGGIGGMGGVTLAGLAGGLGTEGINRLGVSATDNADPLIGGVALPALGLVARGLFNRGVSRAARNAEAAILSRAPYMQGQAIPRGLLSAPQVVGRSLLFAAPALRDEFAPSSAQ